MKTSFPCFAIVLGLSLAGTVHAQEVAPEALLPKGACGYLRLDGWSKHQAAYDKSALAEVMRGDLGQFLGHLWKLIDEKKGDLLKDSSAQASLETAAKVKDQLLDRGVFLAVELVPSKETTHWQATLVFPEDAADGAPGVIERCLEQAAQKPKKVQRGGRSIQCVDGDGSSTCWWNEGGHLVVVYSTDKAQAVLQRLKQRKGNVTQRPLFKETQGKSLVAGFIDAKPFLDLLLPLDESGVARGVLNDLGLLDLGGVTLQAGFEGKAWRETIKFHGGAERKGLLKIFGAGKAVDLANLPALPPDASSVSICALDVPRVAEEVFRTYQKVSARFAVEDEDKGAKAVKPGDEPEFVKDLFGSLGPQMVWFNSPAEGPWVLGWGLAIQVNDPVPLQNLLSVLDQGQKVLRSFGVDYSLGLQKRTYRGVDLWSVQGGSSIASSMLGLQPSFVVHDGWLVMGLYPQVPQGYVFRCQEKAPHWQPSGELRRAVAARKGDNLVAVTEADHRETIKFILSLAPFVTRMIGAYNEAAFDASILPNAHAVAAPMFPTVTTIVDDGKTWTRERSACLPIEPNIPRLYLAAGILSNSAGLLSSMFPSGLPGFQTWVPEKGLTLPSPHYLNHPPQYIPPSPPLSPPFDAPIDPVKKAEVKTGAPPSAPGVIHWERALDPTTGKAIGTKPPLVLPIQQAQALVPAAESEEKIFVKTYDVAALFDKNNPEASLNELRDAIHLVDPDSWQANGGIGAVVIITHRQRLVVRQTAEVHQRIERLLAELGGKGSR